MSFDIKSVETEVCAARTALSQFRSAGGVPVGKHVDFSWGFWKNRA
jgi:hypothetical protein